jgi:hypothetical protein
MLETALIYKKTAYISQEMTFLPHADFNLKFWEFYNEITPTFENLRQFLVKQVLV